MLGLSGLIVLVGLITYLALERTREDTTNAPSIKLFDQDETASLGGVEWQVTKVEFLNGMLLGRDSRFKTATNQVADLPAKGQFLKVSYKVSNQNQVPVSFVASEVKLVGEDNQEYSYVSQAAGWVNQAALIYLKPLQPGESIELTMVYDVPLNGHYSLRVTNLKQAQSQSIVGLINIRS